MLCGIGTGYLLRNKKMSFLGSHHHGVDMGTPVPAWY